MITHNGFREKKCFVQENNIVIDGETYAINSIKETENFKSKMNFILLVMLLYTIFMVYVIYMGFQEQVISNPDSTDRLVKAGFLLLAFSLFMSLWGVVIKYGLIICSNCRSFWLVNGKGLYVEKNDDYNTESRLKEIKLKLPHSTNRSVNPIESKSAKTMIAKIEGILWLLSIVSFFGLVYLVLTNRIKEELIIPLLIIVVASILILRFWQIKKDYLDKLKWKK